MSSCSQTRRQKICSREPNPRLLKVLFNSSISGIPDHTHYAMIIGFSNWPFAQRSRNVLAGVVLSQRPFYTGMSRRARGTCECATPSKSVSLVSLRANCTSRKGGCYLNHASFGCFMDDQTQRMTAGMDMTCILRPRHSDRPVDDHSRRRVNLRRSEICGSSVGIGLFPANVNLWVRIV